MLCYVLLCVPFVFRAPLLGSPPSTVCPSPAKRSFSDSISLLTAHTRLDTALIKHWYSNNENNQGCRRCSLLDNDWLVNWEKVKKHDADVSTTANTTHTPSFRCRDFQTRVQSVQTDPISCSSRPLATWSPKSRVEIMQSMQILRHYATKYEIL